MPQDRLSIRQILDALRQKSAGALLRNRAASGRDTRLEDAAEIEIVPNDAKDNSQTREATGTATADPGVGDSNGAPVAAQGSPVAPKTDETAPPSIRNTAVLLYAGLALVVLLPGLALKNIIDFGPLQRVMLDITFGSGLRFWLGVVGATMTGLLFLYPLRKKFAHRFGIGSVSSWFHWHIVLGVLGPVLILYHANFGATVRDFNANVALWTVMIVAASGLIGQFVYRRASLDFYGAKKQLRTHIDALIADIKSLDASQSDTAAVIQHLEEFEKDIPTSRLGIVQSVLSAFRVQVHHYRIFRVTSGLLADAQRRYSWPQQEYQRLRSLIGANLAASVSIARTASSQSIIEQLVSRWRLLHLPVFSIMAIATVLHVWSVWDKRAFSTARPTTPDIVTTAGVPTKNYTPDEALNALRRWDATTQALTSGQAFFANASFVGSASCKSCHQEQNNEWVNTWHAKMYRTVNDPSAKGNDNIVVGAFDGRAIIFDGVPAKSEDGKDGNVTFEVIPTTKHPETGTAGYFFTVRDPSAPSDVQTFQVAIVIGGNWEQMYHVKVGDNYFASPLRWKVGAPGVGAWQVDNTPQPGNWVYFRGAGNKSGKPRTQAQLPFERFADGQCMGCHTTGYKYKRQSTPQNARWSMVGNSVGNGVEPNGILTVPAPGTPGTAAELGIGCESCHGPGSSHNAAQSDPGGSIPSTPKPLVAGKILHPLKHMSQFQQSMMCGQCHSRGSNDVTPGTGKTDNPEQAANPLGFADVLPKGGDRGFLPGDTDIAARIRMFGGYGHMKQAFWPNDWAKQGRMQWQDFTKSAHYATNTASCLTCHSGHAPMKGRIDDDRFQLRQSAAIRAGQSKTENQCESCHKATGSAMQPNKEMFEGSVMHSAGVTCINCHMAQVGNRIGRTTKTPAQGTKGDGTFDTSTANYGKHWDVSAHTSRVAPTSEGSQTAPGIGMRSACVSCHGPNPRQSNGTQQSDQKLDELSACRKEFVRDRLERLQLGLAAVEKKKGAVLGKARADMQFVSADRSWGAHNWDKTLITLLSAAEEIGASCSGEAACQVSKLVALNTQECSIRRPAIMPPRIATPAVTQPVVKPVTEQPANPRAPGTAGPVPAPPPAQSAASEVGDPKKFKEPEKPSKAAPAAPQLAPLTVFKDCETCPDMIAVPTGDFPMGSPTTEKGRRAVEGPVRRVYISKPFAAARFAVTLEQFEAFVAETKHSTGKGCLVAAADRWTDRPELSYRSPGFAQDGRNPAVCVTFADAKAYAAWLSAKTGKPYRLLSEAEREYVARAKTATAYWWGELFDARAAAHDTNPSRGSSGFLFPSDFLGTVPVQAFKANPWGFFQVHGNVAEWTQDCWNKTLMGLPTDGAAATTGDCAQRVLRGGAWSYWPEDLRSAYREAANAEHRYVHVGFRIARDLEAGQ